MKNSTATPHLPLIYRVPPKMRYALAVAITTITSVTLLQSSTRPFIGPAAPSGPPDLGREIFLTAGHFGVFTTLVLVWTWALVTTIPLRRALLVTVIGAFAYSFLTEWGQSFVPDRTASLYDLVINGLATLITAWMIMRWSAARIHPYPTDAL